MMQFLLPIRVYYEDTDAGGVVHHSSYIKFFERARTEAFRQQGIELNELLSAYGLTFVVHSLTVKYLKPAYLDQLLYVSAEINMIGFASISYNQRVYLERPNGELICEAKIRLACIDKIFKPTALPEILKRLEGKSGNN